MRFWPRTIRWQMLAGLVLLELLSIGLFAGLLVSRLSSELHDRTLLRLASEATSLALQAREAIQQNRPGWVGLTMKMEGDSPNISFAEVTDTAGNVLFASKGEPEDLKLEPAEIAQIPLLKSNQVRVFVLKNGQWEGAAPIYLHGDLHGFAWIENNPAGVAEIRSIVERLTILFGVIWMIASVMLVLLASRAITRPLALLHKGTRVLMNAPDSSGSFPLPVMVDNEFGDLIDAFNRMVASIDEQRSGLNDTLSLLDSMLANAPIGLAFFDRNCRIVRVNQVFAEMTGVPLSRHLGRTLPEVLPQPVAKEMEDAALSVFATGNSVRDLELNGRGGPQKRTWTWLVNAYPVRTAPNEVRWAGMIVMDASERKRSEEALRRSEKLAATGRLAASISHEINNPLEAITNLLFLLRNYSPLEGTALDYVTMAQHEARRISEITQQTLRFYRQSTLPARAHMGDLLDSVLSLYQMRVYTLGIRVDRDFDRQMDLYCFAGEVRQVIANLVGNAIDATSRGGRLIVRARRSVNWKGAIQRGVRITVADTGSGIEEDARPRIFEAFFTTKEETGTGLGLWVSHEIIMKHHGLVRMRSRPASKGGQSGTVFQLFLPDNQNLTVSVQPPVAAEA